MRVNKTISVDHGLWDLFVKDCKDNGTKPSWEIDNLIEKKLEEGNDE